MIDTMSRKIIILAIVIVVVIGVFVFMRKSQPQLNADVSQNSSQETMDSFTALTSRELASMLENKDFFFVNVHIPYDGDIKNTDASIPYDKITDNLDKLPKDKNAKIVLYCRSGRMSEIAAKELVKLGYSNVSHLAGGMIDWEKNGYEIIKK